jgi:carboxyl-terminal processing protease
VLFLSLVLLPGLRAAGPDPTTGDTLPQILARARQMEAGGHWIEASEQYALALSKNRALGEARNHYQLCLRHAQQIRRHRDASYRQQMQTLSLVEALQVYREVLSAVHTYYVDREKAELPVLFTNGLDELRFALDDPEFQRGPLARVDRQAIIAFGAQLQSRWGTRAGRRLGDVVGQARELALATEKALGLKPAAVILELTCGACAALDEYTTYLTPGQFNELDAAWKGKFVGVGVELSAEGGKLLVAQVVPGSSAQLRGVKVGDRVLRIAGKTIADLPTERAGELLQGEAGSGVELEVQGVGEAQPHFVQLRRQELVLPSVSEPRFIDERLGIGYLQLVGFQETTVQELDAAITQLQMDGMRVLVLDLRGNPGGLFDVAVQVAQRFLSAGLIVSTQGRETVREYNTSYYASGMNVLDVPLVLLVDGETASSAEMLAGALKDHQRGRLVGQTTFGKGSIQKVRRLTVVPAGIRLTVAKFYSPTGQAYTGNGVTPQLLVPRAPTVVELEQDAQVQAALDVARSLALAR